MSAQQVRITAKQFRRGGADIGCEHCGSAIAIDLPSLADALKADSFTLTSGLHEQLRLTPTQARLFDCLHEARGAVAYATLEEATTGYEDGESVRAHIHHLRKKLVGSRWRIVNIRGAGYRLAEEPQP